MNRCIVPGCKTGRASSASLFQVPKDPIIREKWAKAINSKFNDITIKYGRVCELHFPPEAISRSFSFNFNGKLVLYPKDRVSLRKGAVPTVNINFESAPTNKSERHWEKFERHWAEITIPESSSKPFIYIPSKQIKQEVEDSDVEREITLASLHIPSSQIKQEVDVNVDPEITLASLLNNQENEINVLPDIEVGLDMYCEFYDDEQDDYFPSDVIEPEEPPHSVEENPASSIADDDIIPHIVIEPAQEPSLSIEEICNVNLPSEYWVKIKFERSPYIIQFQKWGSCTDVEPEMQIQVEKTSKNKIWCTVYLKGVKTKNVFIKSSAELQNILTDTHRRGTVDVSQTFLLRKNHTEEVPLNYIDKLMLEEEKRHALVPKVVPLNYIDKLMLEEERKQKRTSDTEGRKNIQEPATNCTNVESKGTKCVQYSDHRYCKHMGIGYRRCSI